MVEQMYGGPWTEEKLTRLRKYLEAYTQIFTKNPAAASFRRVYVDAFAGSGTRQERSTSTDETSQPLFEPDTDAETSMKGSVQVALEIEPPFDEYFFIERDPSFAADLEDLVARYPSVEDRVILRTGDANKELVDWANRSDWRFQRAIVFLDPYGMQVEWPTIATLAETKAVDLWLLFPLGQAVNRLLTRDGRPPDSWADRLTATFGTEDWKERFYKRSRQPSLFGDDPHFEKEATFEEITQFFLERLETVFEEVAQKPLVLMNSHNNRIFLLCFASANPKGAPTAVKIAQDILGG